MDPADGSPVSNTPGFHSKRLKWRNTIEPQEKRSLIIEILNQVFLGKTNFSITGKLADKIGCSKNLGMDELNWLKKQDGYKKIYGEVRSNFLQRKNQR